MASPAEIERKVRQLDNDVQAIYEMLATIEATQKRQGNRLNEVAEKLNEVAVTQVSHGEKLNVVAATQVDHGEKLNAILELLRRNQSQ
jgi:hypothetical protein